MASGTGIRAIVTGASRGVGRGIAVRCDHRDDPRAEALFAHTLAELGGLDLLVNSASRGYENMSEAGEFTWPRPYLEQPLWRWDAVFAARRTRDYGFTDVDGSQPRALTKAES